MSAVAGGTGLGFASLAERGTVWPQARPTVPFADGRLPTPSGRVELASRAAAADGHGLLPSSHADPRPAPGRLRLLSPASAWSLNASFPNDPKVARRAGPQALGVAAADAAALGLAEGEPAQPSDLGASTTVHRLEVTVTPAREGVPA